MKIPTLTMIQCMETSYHLGEAFKGKRIDLALAEASGTSRSAILKLIKQGMVCIAGKAVLEASAKLKGRSTVFIANRASEICQEPKISFLYEDEHLIAVNKPAGISMYRGAGDEQCTLVDILSKEYKLPLSDLRGRFRAGVVHRLDKDTSGAVLFAKSVQAHSLLEEQIKNGQMKRNYLALVWGKSESGSVECYLHKVPFKRMRVAPTGQYSATKYELLESSKQVSLINCCLQTGRTHQIRVHMEHIGHSVVGDQIYGKNRRRAKRSFKGPLLKAVLNFGRQALHSSKLSFFGVRGKRVEVNAPMPSDMAELCSLLGIEGKKFT